MQFKHFIGIDISKATFDVFVREQKLHKQFRNDAAGFGFLMQWLQKNFGSAPKDMLICFEHTGFYSLPLAVYLEEHFVPYAMISALQIKRSLGISRGKNDKIDARRIAEYAYLYRESIVQTKLPPKEIMKLQSLLTLRDRLVRIMSGYCVTRNETLRIMNGEDLPELFAAYNNVIAAMKTEIKELERAIKKIISANEQLQTTFKLITGIKGIGFIVGVYLIVYTCNFTRFDSWRKFACYAGIAPFEYQSGTSVNGRTQVSSLANRQIKKMLHIAGLSAAFTDTEMREYYQRRLSEGKSKMSTLNIIRNKVLARAFAVARRQTPYIDTRGYAA